MKKLIILITFLLFTNSSWLKADMPGNKPRGETVLNFSGIDNYPAYTFYFTQPYSGESVPFQQDTTIVLPGGFGAPPAIEVWAIETESGISTDTSGFGSSGGDDDETIDLLVSIDEKTHKLTITTVKKEHSDPVYKENSGGVTPSYGGNHKNLLIITSGAALLVLSLLAILRNKKTSKI